ncbi:hypothetical protein PYH37_002826 [Sinorhizobium numidicum]|uniref:Uncharacterized protein n=1 Tax=Sinorhizobium numidicum TaxID=680248 RepID=A0ABY8D676_9HYPH|nr:hypothetical protein [Sinorhizobium numidicum]WEX77982.1 hypothetical protein PYH37_002826 [Sinorhizobium numidicum]WEX84641.1 hypothetical protein PYH38_003539 [Sinorhizobium numidicum]
MTKRQIAEALIASGISLRALQVGFEILSEIGAEGHARIGSRALAERLRIGRHDVRDLVREVEATGVIRSRFDGSHKIFEVRHAV